jgi:uncharacterized protein
MTSENNYIVIDNSTLIGAALFPDSIPNQAMRLAFELFDVATSPAMLDELIVSLRKPKHVDRYGPVALRQQFFEQYKVHTICITPTERFFDCRDVNDNMVLELAHAAKAAVIVSSDKDLKDMKTWHDIPILSPREFLDQLS